MLLNGAAFAPGASARHDRAGPLGRIANAMGFEWPSAGCPLAKQVSPTCVRRLFAVLAERFPVAWMGRGGMMCAAPCAAETACPVLP